MAAFIHTIAMKAKPGRLADARAEAARLAERVTEIGASVRMLTPTTGDPLQATMVIEFGSGEAWAEFTQSDAVREARRARLETDYPIEVLNTMVYQELTINPD